MQQLKLESILRLPLLIFIICRPIILNGKGTEFRKQAKREGKAQRRQGQSHRRKDKNKIKTKAKTENRNVGRRQQRVAVAKATRSNESVDRNRGQDEAVPAAASDA